MSKELKSGTYHMMDFMNFEPFWPYFDKHLQELISKKIIGFKYCVYSHFGIEVVVWIIDEEAFDKYFYHNGTSKEQILDKLAYEIGQALRKKMLSKIF